MPENDPSAAIRTPSGGTPPSGAAPGEAPPFPVPDHTLIRRVGRGAYGEVWLARNTLGAWRAVKFIRRNSFDDDRPFEREFAGIQRFEPISRSHESQLNILHVGRAEGGFYYVMELADDMGRGQDIDEATYTPRNLRSELHLRGRLPAAECLRIGLALTTALEHLHKHGLVHRDIKPSNIVFVNGIPKLADIGLVARAEATASFVGTEGFLPPEGPGTRQADIYSLGKVLYELSTGHDRQQFPELPTNIVELPDRAELSELNEVLLKACHRDPKERYQTAAEMHADLALLESGRSVVRMRGLERRLRLVQRAGAVVTVIAALAAGLYLWQARQTKLVRNLADQNRQIAEEKTKLAAEKSSLAEANREQLLRLRVANGVRLMDEGDLSGALLWFAEALPLVTNRPAEEAVHRIRIQQVLDQTPHLLQVWAEDGSISAGAFSPDGRYIATATGSGTLRVWDVQSGKVSWEIEKLNGDVRQVRFTRDGRRLQVGSSLSDSHEGESLPPQGFLTVLDAQTGQEVFPAAQILPGMTSNLICLAFSPNDRWMAVANSNHVIRLLDAHDGSFVAELAGHTNTIHMLAFNPQGTLLASVGKDKTARLWKVPSGEPFGVPLLHNLPVGKVSWSDDGSRLLTATSLNRKREEGFIQVWDVATGARIGNGARETKIVHTMAFCPGNGDRFILGLCGKREQVEMRATETMQPAFPTLKKKGGEIWCIAFSADGKTAAVGTDTGWAYTWNLGTGEPLRPPFRHAGYLQSVQFSPDDTQLLTTSDDGTVKLWDLRAPAESASHQLDPDPMFYVQESWGRLPGPLLLFLTDGSVALVDPVSLKEVHRLKPTQTNSPPYDCVVSSSGRAWAMYGGEDKECGAQVLDLWRERPEGLSHLKLPHPAWTFPAIFSPDEGRLVSYCADRNFRIWKTSDGTLEQVLPLDEGREMLQFLPDASRALVRRKDEALELLDIASQRVLSVIIPNPQLRGATPEWRLELDPQGTRLAAIGRQQGIVYDLSTGQPLTPVFKHGGRLLSLDFSPDGSRLLTAGVSPESKMWDCRTGELLLHPMRIDDTPSRFATWSPDGRFITTFNDANTARVWDAATAEAVTPLLRHETELNWAAVARGNRLITLSDPNEMRAWNLKPCSLPLAVITDYAKLMSGHRCSDSGVLLPLKAKELAELHRSLRARAPQLFE